MSDNDATSRDDNPTKLPHLTGQEKVVMLFTAETDDGRPFYAYIKLTLLKLGEFHEAQQKGEAIDLNQLGEVLHTGWGHTPPDDIHKKIVAEHGDPRQLDDNC